MKRKKSILLVQILTLFYHLTVNVEIMYRGGGFVTYTSITAKRYKMADITKWRQVGGLTWHYVLDIILLFSPLLLAEANGGREEKYGAPKRYADRQPSEDVRPVVPYRRVVF